MTAMARRDLVALALGASALLGVGAGAARAQGGPPLVTDDAETLRGGEWEINLAAIGAFARGRREFAAPNADINYGWGKCVQLKLDLPWTFVHEPGERPKSGLGAANVGIKWRFLGSACDSERRAGVAMSVFPQVEWSWLQSSVSRGITEPGKQFLLPLEASTEIGDYKVAFEVGRNFVEHRADEWVAGTAVARACGWIECAVEIRARAFPHDTQVLANLGVRWKIDSLELMLGGGREWGRRTDDQLRGLVYVGVKLQR